MNIPTCSHIKANGTLCGSPALRRSRFCYYHDADRRQRSKIQHAASLRERARLAPPTAHQLRQVELTDIHTPRGIQRAMDTILQSVWTGTLDAASATAMINAIKLKMRVEQDVPSSDTALHDIESLLSAMGVALPQSPVK